MTYARKLRRQNLRRQSSQPFQPKLPNARAVRGRACLFPELLIIDDPMPQRLTPDEDRDRLMSWFQSAVAKRFDNAMLSPISIPAPPEAFTIETLRQAIERMRELSIPPNPDGTYTFDVHPDSVAAQLFQSMGEDDGSPLGLLTATNVPAIPVASDDAPAD